MFLYVMRFLICLVWPATLQYGSVSLLCETECIKPSAQIRQTFSRRKAWVIIQHAQLILSNGNSQFSAYIYRVTLSGEKYGRERARWPGPGNDGFHTVPAHAAFTFFGIWRAYRRCKWELGKDISNGSLNLTHDHVITTRTCRSHFCSVTGRFRPLRAVDLYLGFSNTDLPWRAQRHSAHRT